MFWGIENLPTLRPLTKTPVLANWPIFGQALLTGSDRSSKLTCFGKESIARHGREGHAERRTEGDCVSDFPDR